MKPSILLLLPTPILVFLLIRAELRGKRRQVYILKPLATLIVIAVSAASFWAPSRNLIYSVGVLIGLLFSLGGDVALMFQEHRRWFMTGLVSFLIGHIAYTAAFGLLGKSSNLDYVVAAALLLAAIGIYALLRPGLGKMKAPVIAYMLVISIMVSRAATAAASPVFRPRQALMIIAGALLFYFSDVILAANRFWKPFKYHRLSLALYYAGQFLIAAAASEV